jgi:hypothetical protein
MRYTRGEAILRVIAMRYAPQLIVSQNECFLRHATTYCVTMDNSLTPKISPLLSLSLVERSARHRAVDVATAGEALKAVGSVLLATEFNISQ